MVVTCDIQFEQNPEATYFAGQVIMGKITLTADKIKQFKAVNLKISGSTKTRWKKRQSRCKSAITYGGEVEYLNTVTCLLAPTATDQAVIIEPGIHTFSFVCHIPVNCLSSFEGQFGSTRYIVQVSLERPWKFDQTFTKAFTVLAVKDLNFDSSFLEFPINNILSRTFCCGPFESDSLEINVHLPQKGFVPGQHIPVRILIADDTKSHTINEICLRLVMVIDYVSKWPCETSKSETKPISELKEDSVFGNSEQSFHYSLPIPATPPTCSAENSIIQIVYLVEVVIKLQGFMYRNKCICIETPVTIGNVPLYTNRMIFQEQPKPRSLNIKNKTQPPNTNGAVVRLENNNDFPTNRENKEPWAAIANMPAPVYMEAPHIPQAQLSEDNTHDYGEKTFIPKYPVFNIPSPAVVQPITSDEIPPMVATHNTTWL